MTHYSAYLEIDQDGRCLAHVPELPGCLVRARSRALALAGLPEAIDAYHAWMRDHGESGPATDANIEIEVAGESEGFGPFDRRGRAALFPPDREPVTLDDIERTFCLLAYSRADLLALVADLPDEILDWRPQPKSFSMRELLRHVGNAEKWYVSRLVPADTLPAEWQHGDDLPILAFLDMQRRTVMDRLRALTEEQRSEVIYPTHRAYHPEEPWTARKALRRFVEHEREHTWQVREILEARRSWWLARLAAARAELLARLLGLDAATLIQVPIVDNWTVQDLLAHIAAWDRWDDQITRQMVSGQMPDLTPGQEIDASNEAFVSAWREQAAGLDDREALAGVVAQLEAARAPWLDWLAGLPLEELTRRRAGGDWSFDPNFTGFKVKHDLEHADQIAAWREVAGQGNATGPKEILLAALDAARRELLACAALIPPAERATRPVCGTWTLQDVLAHIAAWEWLGAEALRHMAAGQPPAVELVADIDTWNQAQVEARRGQPWAVIQDEVDTARHALLEALEHIDEERLAQLFPQPWGGEGSPYGWASIYAEHDREHASDLHTWPPLPLSQAS